MNANWREKCTNFRADATICIDWGKQAENIGMNCFAWISFRKIISIDWHLVAYPSKRQKPE